MSAPAYYRPRVPPALWIILFTVVALGAAIVITMRVFDRIRRDEAQRVYREAAAAQTTANRIEAQLVRLEIDSLTREVARRDSVLNVTDASTRSAIARLQHALAHPETTPPETIKVAAEGAIRACTAEADDCAAFRETAARTIALQDSSHRSDSSALRSMSFAYVARGDSLRDARARASTLVSRSDVWHARVEYGTYGAIVGALSCLIFCR